MTTNGYLLDLKNFIRFYDAGIRIFQITLDGFSHDKFRMLSTGENTLKVILENIYNILRLDERYEFEIDIRINVNEDNNDLKWYDFLKSYLGDDRHIKYMVAITSNWGGDTIKKVRLINENKRTIKKIHNEYIKNLGLQLVCENKGPCSDVWFSSFKKGFVFRANGDIEKCTIALDKKSNKVGYVDHDKGVIINDDLNKLWYQSRLHDSCITCKDVCSCLNKMCEKYQIIDGIKCSKCLCKILEDI